MLVLSLVTVVNRALAPLSSICGQECDSPAAGFVTGCGVPPLAGTLRRGPLPPEKTMFPLLPHVAPLRRGASARYTGAPPWTATLFNLPGLKNPIHCPSEEKNGLLASSVPGNSVGSIW